MSRTARLNPDSRPVLTTAVALTSLLGAVSFALSYSGLVAVAAWAAVPPSLAWAVPVTIDGAILVYTLAVLVFRARGEGTATSWAGLGLFTAVSVFANGAHAWEAGHGDAKAVIGTGIAGLAPVAVLLATHTIADLVIARPEPASAPEPPADVEERQAWKSRTFALAYGATPEQVAALASSDWPTVSGDSGAPGIPARERQATRLSPEYAFEAPASRPTIHENSRPARVPASPERDAQVRALAAEGLSVRAIAERLGIGKSTAARVLAAPASA